MENPQTCTVHAIALLLTLFLFSCQDSADPAIQSELALLNLDWHDLAELELEGKGWPEEQASFHRLPPRAQGKVTPGVWELSKHSSGLALHFITDSREIYGLWSGAQGDPILALDGISGLDLYRRTGEGSWEYISVGKPRVGRSLHNLTFDYRNGRISDEPEEHEYLLYLPILIEVSELKIGLEPGSKFEVIPNDATPLVFYGTSIVQGAWASKAGMGHTGMLRRWLDREIINLGFSGVGQMEPEMAELICEIETDLYVIDCMPNMTAAMTADRFKPFFTVMTEKRPDTPIIIVEHHRRYAEAKNNALEEGYLWFRDIHPSPVGYFYQEEFEDREFGYIGDGIHPTDLGHYKMATVLEQKIKDILEEAETE